MIPKVYWDFNLTLVNILHRCKVVSLRLDCSLIKDLLESSAISVLFSSNGREDGKVSSKGVGNAFGKRKK